MLRFGHGNRPQDEWYTRSAVRALASWRALEEDEGADLLAPCGLAWFAREDDALVRGVEEGLAAVGVDHEWIDAAALGRLFPDLATDDLAGALLEPGACLIRATAAVEALLARARRHGAEVRLERATPAGPGGVRLGGGEELGADCVVWACGAWLGALFPEDAPVRPAWQNVLYWQAPPAWRSGPAWFDERDGLYGFPDLDGLGLKAVSHQPGRAFDLDRENRVPDPRMTERVARYLARRFPALDGTGLLHARVMPYEMTADEHFLVAPAETSPGHWLLGGGSGHGFKHAPSLGEHIADLLEGRADLLPAFRAGPRGGR
jgi:sarcosine oxidase